MPAGQSPVCGVATCAGDGAVLVWKVRRARLPVAAVGMVQ